MPRFKALEINEAQANARTLLEGVQKKLGKAPNLMRTMANSPAVLEAYLSFSGTLAKGTLPARLREQISLAVGEENSCKYCVAAHATLGRMTGLSDEEIADSRRASSPDSKTDAALSFARKIVTDRGQVSDADVAKLRDLGFSDGEILEIVSAVALNIFTNYVNHVAGTTVDFPEVDPVQAPACAC